MSTALVLANQEMRGLTERLGLCYALGNGLKAAFTISGINHGRQQLFFVCAAAV
jgi:hypothetical protein